MVAGVAILIAYALANIMFAVRWDSLPPRVLDFTIGAYDKEFWKNCLVNLHSSIFDFIILTILWNLLSSRLDRYRKIDEELRIIEVQRVRQKYYSEAGDDLDAVTSLRRIIELDALEADVSEVSFALLELPKKTAIRGMNMSDCKFSGAALEQTCFRDCILKRAEFTNFSNSAARRDRRADLGGIEFQRCNLEKASFADVKLSRAVFIQCDLNTVDFRASNLKAAVFDGCQFNQTSFVGVTMMAAEFRRSWPTLEQLDEASKVFPIKINGQLCRNRTEAGIIMSRASGSNEAA